MQSERRYYLAKGEDEKIVRDFFERRQSAFAAASDIAKKHGGTAVTSSRMVGLAFDGDPPSGWRKAGVTNKAEPYYLPVARSKAGKLAKAEILEIKIPDAMELHSKFAPLCGGVWGEAGPRGGFYITYITAEIIGGKCIIHVPEKMDFEPAHSKPLKKSEYWKLKEASEQAAA